MKKNIWLIPLFTLFLMPSCETHESNEVETLREIKRIVLYFEPSQPVLGDEDIGGPASSNSANTRSGAVVSSSSWHSYFQHNDSIGIFAEGGAQIPFLPPIEEGDTAHKVDIVAQGWMTKIGIMYAAYMPYYFYNRYYNKVYWSFFKKTPIQPENGANVSTTPWDFLGPQMLMVTPVVPATEDGMIQAGLSHQGCIVRIQCRMPLGGTFVKMVLASSKSDAFITHGYVDMFSEGQPFTPKGYINYMTLMLNNFEVASSGVITAYFIAPPSNLVGTNLTLYVWDNLGNCYSGPKNSLTSSQGNWKKNGYVKLTYTNLTAEYNVPSVYLTPFEYEEEIDTGVALED